MQAYLAGGCFWCMAKPYTEVDGVLQVESGYCGGEEAAPRYEDVKHQKTGHRETVRVAYDEAILSFDALLDVYFYNIDPFDDGGQFIDRGHSYTCAIYYADEAQKTAAERKIAVIEKAYGRKVCVSVEPYRTFYPAEDYHQNYAQTHPAEYAEEERVSGRTARTEADRVKI